MSTRITSSWTRRAAVGALGAVALSGVVVGSSSVAHATTTKPLYYVSLGDSYAMGYQPGYTNNSETLHGFANNVVTDAKATLKRNYTLVNFGCGGATTNSIINTIGCPPGASPTGGPSYPTQTQAAAAEAFISAHPGQIGLITVSIGGNDFDGCPGQKDAIGCVSSAMAPMKANLTTLLTGLRSAAGPKVSIVGITYPDVILGLWVRPPVDQAFAKLSVSAFSLLINPTLKSAYTAANATFVDITAATSAYVPLTKLTTLKPYGKIPVAVAQVCTLTWFCAKGDIHPQTSGYKLIATTIVATMKAKHL